MLKTCALVGRPNVGKSTLLNAWINKPLAIVSSKPQTTWYEVEGVAKLGPDSWLIVDTPGLHSTYHRAQNKQMNRIAKSVMDMQDAILMLVRCGQWTEMDQWVCDQLAHFDKPKICVVNQIDRMPGKVVDFFQDIPSGLFQDVVPISALKKTNLDLLAVSMNQLPIQPHEEQVEQPSIKFLAQEMVREQIMRYTHKEIPYSVEVEVFMVQTIKEACHIEVKLHVVHQSQKKVLVGSQGQMIKRIGIGARHRLQDILDTPVVLKLWVSISKNKQRRAGDSHGR